MSTLAVWCRVVRSRDVRSRDFSAPKKQSVNNSSLINRDGTGREFRQLMDPVQQARVYSPSNYTSKYSLDGLFFGLLHLVPGNTG